MQIDQNCIFREGKDGLLPPKRMLRRQNYFTKVLLSAQTCIAGLVAFSMIPNNFKIRLIHASIVECKRTPLPESNRIESHPMPFLPATMPDFDRRFSLLLEDNEALRTYLGVVVGDMARGIHDVLH